MRIGKFVDKTSSDRKRKLDKSQTIQLILAVTLTLALSITVPTYAWFSSQKEMAVSTKIDSPATLEIKSGGSPGAEQAIINFELSDIDTENKSYPYYSDGNEVKHYYKDFVFCVKGQAISSYDLQLAHTTNIAFKYDIYTAIPDNNGDIVYMPKDNNVANSQKYRLARIRVDGDGNAVLVNNDAVYDDYLTPLDGNYVNVTQNGNRIIANSGTSPDLTSRSYDLGQGGSGDQFQKYANPAYWIKRNIIVHPIQKQDGRFTHSYVLRISWVMPDSITASEHEGDLDIVQNNKETDMIYITARARS